MAEPKTKTITDKEPTLKEMQEFVGGYIEVAYDDGATQIICNEEGKLLELPLNKEATSFWEKELMNNSFYEPLGWQDFIVGNALILKGKARLT